MRRVGSEAAGLLVALWIAFFRINTAGAIDDSLSSRQILKGLPGVIVGVLDSPDCEGAGLYVRTDVELRLRRAGITVLTHEGPGLEIMVFCYRIKEPRIEGYSFALRVALQRVIWWPYPPPTAVTVITWRSRAVLGVGNRATLTEDIRSGVRDMVDEFINAWLSVNPIK